MKNQNNEHMLDGEVVGTYAEIMSNLEEAVKRSQEERLNSPNRLELDLMTYCSEINAMGDMWDLIDRAGRNNTPYTDLQIVKGFRYAWETTEFLYQYKDIIDMMLVMTYPYRKSFMTPKEYGKLWGFSPKFKVYRGASQDGYSWTLSKEKAEWFVERNKYFGDGDAYLMEKVVSKNDVFGYINARKEKEVIILPENVKKYLVE